jgi:hypothetical protein
MLVFVHIPKTAGTTLHKVISHQYRRDRILIRHDADGPLAAAIPPGAAKLPEVVTTRGAIPPTTSTRRSGRRISTFPGMLPADCPGNFRMA